MTNEHKYSAEQMKAYAEVLVAEGRMGVITPYRFTPLENFHAGRELMEAITRFEEIVPDKRDRAILTYTEHVGSSSKTFHFSDEVLENLKFRAQRWMDSSNDRIDSERSSH